MDVARFSNIFLVGPMGAGKTTLGRHLAKILKLDFVDADHEIEAHTGVDIGYIFEKEGETGFRQREARMIDELTLRSGLVLATGGGAVLDADNRRHLAARGFVVYLRASVRQQVARTRRCRNRPLLQNKDRRATLERLFEQRDPLYREVADLVLETDYRNTRKLAREIVHHLRRPDRSEARAC